MPRPKSDLSPRILEVARRRFLAEGVDGASLRSIAAEAGTTIGMIYYYYPTKDDLFEAVVWSIYAGMLKDAEDLLRGPDPAETRLARFYARVGAMSEEEFDVVRIVLRESFVSSSRLEKLARRAVEGHIPWLVATVAEARGKGTFDPNMPLPVQLSATMLLAVMPQIMLRLVQRSNLEIPIPLPTSAALAEHMVGVLVHGVRGGSGR